MNLPSPAQIFQWGKDNQLMLGLIASAVIGAMPEMLPSLREFPQWLWTWFRDSAKTFLNFRKLMDNEPKTAQQQKLEQQKLEAVQKEKEKEKDAKQEAETPKKPGTQGPLQLNG